jgi:hypothetical protein
MGMDRATTARGPRRNPALARRASEGWWSLRVDILFGDDEKATPEDSAAAAHA